MKYRPDIDGLRAIAVIPVILFHAGVSIFSGGFLGVDIFFVISGYLITNILLNEKSLNLFSLVDFYNRRAKRILPPLCLMLVLSSVFAYLLMIPSQLGDYGQSLIASLTFSANIYFWIKTNYWGQSAELTPLIHIWSLGVEEQFYLLFPLILILCRSKKQLLIALLLIGITSFISMLFFYNQGDISEVFYLLPFRMWELIAGSISAILALKLGLSGGSKIKNILGIGAFLVLMMAILIFDRQTHPAFLYPMPILAACILVTNSKGLVVKILSYKPLVYIGSISYGLYLFHQPALGFTRIYTFGNPSILDISLSLSVSLILAALSYRYLESPIKNGGISLKIFYPSILSVIAVLISFGGYVTFTNGLRTYQFSKMNLVSAESFKRLEDAKQERHDLWEGMMNQSATPFSSAKGRKILFLGDSMSEDLYISSIERQKTTQDHSQYKRLKLDDACFRFLDSAHMSALQDPSCKQQIESFINSDLLKNSTDIVIANLWEPTNVGTISKLLSLKQIEEKNIILYAAPTFTDMTSLLYYLSKSEQTSHDPGFMNFIYRNRNERRISINTTIEAVANKYQTSFINAFDFYCSDINKTCNLFDGNGVPWIIDGMHLSPNGIQYFSPWLAEKLILTPPVQAIKSN